MDKQSFSERLGAALRQAAAIERDPLLADAMTRVASSSPFTPEQLRLRASGIGASENFDLVRGNLVALWQRKKGIGPPDGPDSVDAEFGRRFEAPVLQWYHERTGTQSWPVTTQAMQGHPRVLATPDALVMAPGPDGAEVVRVVDAKCPRHGDDWGPDGSTMIPERYWWQLQQQMAVTRAPEAHLAALVYRELRIYPIARNQPAIDALVTEIEYFWTTYIDGDAQPPVDGSDACHDYLLRRFPRGEQRTWVDGDACAEAARAYRAAAEAEKSAAAEKSRARNILQAHIGDHYGARGEWGKAVWSARRGREKTNYRAIVMDVLQQFGVTGAEARRQYEALHDEHTAHGTPYGALKVTLASETETDDE